MNYITPKEASLKWGISERMVCRYCIQKRIPKAFLKDGVWSIPEDASKPIRVDSTPAPVVPPLLKKLLKMSSSQHYHGLYDYLQINMVYSNNRMASNRLTRNQVEMLYKSDKIFTNNETIKVNDIIETRNHFLCVNHVLSNAMKPLTQTFALELQALLVSPHCSHKRKAPSPTGYRTTETFRSLGFGSPVKEIRTALNQLFTEYEEKREIDFKDILNLHVQFERIRPFEDCNGRVGRLLMLKECLRHEVMPFVIDDKRRTGYLDGIRQWDEDRTILMHVCMEAQMRFEAQIELQKLSEQHWKRMRGINSRR